MRRTSGGLFLAAMLVAPAGVSGQVGTVNASATIVGQLTVNDLADLNFGAIVPGTGQVVNLGAGATPAGTTRGVIEVQHSSNFTVVSNVPTQLTGPDVIDVTFECGYSGSQGGAIAGGSFDCASPAAGPATVVGTPTTTYLQVGGTILAGDTSLKPAGTYTGTLQFTFSPTL